MAGPVSSVYRLIVDQLREECIERGLDSSGPVRILRGRLAEHIKSETMERADDQSRIQASVPSDLPSSESDKVHPTGFRVSHGSAGDSQIHVLTELLRQVPPCCRRNPRKL
jgi:hypothetical protein